jgi:hypothetical protein
MNHQRTALKKPAFRAAGFTAVCFALLSMGVLAWAAPMKGTRQADTITGTDGPDRVIARAGDDTIDTKAGRDRVHAGQGKDTVDAGAGRDIVWGATGNDTLSGGPGRDLIFAQRGVDTVNGGEGADSLWALARRDVAHEDGEPADTVDGGPGHDLIHVRDGEADKVTCGPGVDRVWADFKDVVDPDCERVQRRGPHAGDDDREV